MLICSQNLSVHLTQHLNASTTKQLIKGKIMNHQFGFEKLEVWQLAKDFVVKIYKLTKEFPDFEKYGLISQINRASVSVASNLAEGTSRTSPKDQAHFSQLAYSSLMEVLCQLIIANELGYLDDVELAKLRKLSEEISNKINALRNYQLNKSTNKHLNN